MSNNAKHYLIKRNPYFARGGVLIKRNKATKVYSETVVTSNRQLPGSSVLKLGDIVYVYETGYGIYAVGKVIDLKRVRVFRSISQILDYYVLNNLDDTSYWLDKIIRLRKGKIKDSKYVLKFHEYHVNQFLLDRTIPIGSKLSRLSKRGSRRSFIGLTPEEVGHITSPVYEDVKALESKIPSHLRMDIYNLFSRELSIQHWVDIDHFVPQSLGGPGNIKENLVPVGLSLNRYKSNSVPLGVFTVSSDYPDLKKMVPKDIHLGNLDYLKEKKYKEGARKILNIVNTWEIEKVRKFYALVLAEHNPKYWKIISGL